VPLLSTVISTLYSGIIQDSNYEDIKMKIYIFLLLYRVFCADAERECMITADIQTAM